MTGLVGADVEGLERLAAEFESGARELRDLSSMLSGSIDAARDWQGPDADRCKQEWGTLALQQMTGVSDALETAGRLLSENAQEQERASGAERGAAAGYGVLAIFSDLKALVQYLKTPAGPLSKAKALFDFLRLLRAGNLGRIVASAQLIEALQVFMGGTRTGGILGKLGLPALGKLLGKVFLPVTAITGAIDIVTGGGYDGWRGWATRGFAVAGTAGALTLLVGGAALVASAPITATVAAVGVAAYGLWSAGNYLVDHWDSVKSAGTRLGSAVYRASTEAWQGVVNGYQEALGWARGLLGGTRPVGAGA
ncbi:hypothetical protein [Nocardioides sp. GXZ039]|uniref:hypothetical protein n=1 Tax=Nocardioides sp. GXZ039 TaxID=3136018 RepID=UPI0030F444CA